VTAGALERGRDAFVRRSWRDAYERLRAADSEAALEPDDLERLATAAFLVGESETSAEVWTRAHQALLSGGHTARAARCAFWLGYVLLDRGELAPAMGWFGRGQRLLDDEQLECVERGYLLIPVAISSMGSDPAGACGLFERAIEIGERFGEPDLVAVARAGRGRSLINMGRVTEGVALLDEAMVAVTSGELGPVITGDVYCAVIEACFQIADLRRAREWTNALNRWCESQPELVPYRGQCLVHRAEIMQLRGSWPDALDQVLMACDLLAHHPMLGAAFYQLGELHRLRGKFDEAEDAYRNAGEHGREPQPGLALMRLAQGRTSAALSAVRRVLDATGDPVERAKLLAASVEIALVAGDLVAARSAADELAAIAAVRDSTYVTALSESGAGMVQLEEGDPGGALVLLSRARSIWNDLDATHEVACVRVSIARACRALDDEDTAAMELDAARRVFAELGAEPDVARVDALAPPKSARTAGLTPREIEVLRLVAGGRTNRAIAGELVLSEKTVARHVSNIFAKLGVSSRSAATAYAYEHDLV
jgi:DNA-binding CsgD family transcriptional regulator